MTRRLTRQSALLAVSILAFAAPMTARAETIFSNFGPGSSYDIGSANPVGFDFFTGDNDAQGVSFMPLITTTLFRLEIALSDFNATNSDPVTVSLRADAAGLPGAVFETWIIASGALGTFGDAKAPILLASVLAPSLTVANPYWVTAAGSGSDPVAWNLSDTADANATATSVDGGATWNNLGLTLGAVQLDGPQVATPQSGSIVLLATGFAGVAAFRLRRRKPLLDV